MDTARLDADIAFVGQHEHLPGLAMAVVEDGQVVYRHAKGARGDGGQRVDMGCVCDKIHFVYILSKII